MQQLEVSSEPSVGAHSRLFTMLPTPPPSASGFPQWEGIREESPPSPSSFLLLHGGGAHPSHSVPKHTAREPTASGLPSSTAWLRCPSSSPELTKWTLPPGLSIHS